MTTPCEIDGTCIPDCQRHGDDCDGLPELMEEKTMHICNSCGKQLWGQKGKKTTAVCRTDGCKDFGKQLAIKED